MSLNEKMTGLMDALRNRYALTDKMSLTDATTAISKIALCNPVELDFGQGCNNSVFSKTNNGYKYIAVNDDKYGITGPYQYYDQRIILPGKRYNFSALVRGTIRLKKIGEESNGILLDLPLDAEKWQRLSFNFIAKSDIVIYGTAKVGDWIEVKDAQYSELGGVNSVLFLLLLPSLEAIA